MANILMVNLPYAGHTNPTLPLAKALVGAGHTVGYVNAPEWRGAIETTGAHCIPYREWPDSPTEQQKKTHCFLAAWNTALAVGKSYDILLYEMFFYPGRALAERLGIPCVKQHSQPAWNEAVFAHIRKTAPLFAASSRLIDLQVMGRKTARAIGVAPGGLIRETLYGKAPLHIVYVPEEFQPLRDTFDESYLFTGPPQVAPQAPPASTFASLPRPLIYISMGSIMSSRVFCRRCIKAFEGKPVSVVLTTGRVPPASLGPLPPNIQALSFAPQVELLHTADLFITHAGMNSVNEAMAAGVPMLAMPVLNDQPVNAAEVVRLGIGRRMRAFPTTAGLLYQNAMAALEDDTLRQNARHLREKLARNSNGLQQAVQKIEALL